MEGWKNEYSVGIALMDDQHKELIKILAELRAALDRHEKVDVEYTLIRLEVYALYHFASEEQLLARYAFPGLEEHQREHADFKSRVAALKHKFSDLLDKEFEIATEILGMINEWINGHLLTKDKEYGVYIAGKLGKQI